MPNLDHIPYFDRLLQTIAIDPVKGPPHIHWGVYEPDEFDDDSLDALHVAAERMTRRICDAAEITDSMRILDVGCGCGATILSIDRRFSDCELFGLNIDRRQLRIADGSVLPLARNPVNFIEGDACASPVADNSFDVVLAVECIFHFPSRAQFFREARRVLKPGGRLALSDLLVKRETIWDLGMWIRDDREALGSFHALPEKLKGLTQRGYNRLAVGTGFRPMVDIDVSKATMPTHRAVRKWYGEQGWDDGVAEDLEYAYLFEHNLVEYHILGFASGRPRGRSAGAGRP